jgi:hypothetical protein
MNAKHIIYHIICIALLGSCTKEKSDNPDWKCNEILCKLTNINSTVTIYCNGSYDWQVFYGRKFRTTGSVPLDYFLMIKKSVQSDRQFRIVNGISIYTYSDSNSFSPYPQGVGEFLGYIWQIENGKSENNTE